MEHLEGMLDRDQRTAKRPPLPPEGCPGCTSPLSTKASIQCPRTAPAVHRHRRRRRRRRRRSLDKLQQVLLVGVYLTLATLPAALAAPTQVKMGSRMRQQPKWINPCGLSLDQQDFAPEQHPSLREISDAELLTQIASQANIALNKAYDFQEDFADKTFNMKSTDLQNYFSKQHYDWLPRLPKALGEEIPEQHLQTLQIDETLLDVYEHLQTIAVGLEQIVWDQQDNNGRFSKAFGEAEQYLRNVLCELQMTMIERGVPLRPDVTRDVMSDEFRHMDTTGTKARDWIVLRDYMNCLEYAIKAFTYMKDRL